MKVSLHENFQIYGSFYIELLNNYGTNIRAIIIYSVVHERMHDTRWYACSGLIDLDLAVYLSLQVSALLSSALYVRLTSITAH